ncbi:Nitrite reductase [NAD(P)H] small subunit [Serratia odorifera]|uniref:Nitrite reductase [NAD(P)H] small subunit n=1 Tax=Serratia odorifera TaxID=618 RepID=A0A3S4DFI3_SEROD|nr:Nitrite reductase [NAD(P)H] small subunit [Serratia odorifera]
MSQWINVCSIADILPATGVCALIGEQQVAVFRPYADEQLFAISNIDPICPVERAVTRPDRRTPGGVMGGQPAEKTALSPTRRLLHGR